MMAADPPLRRVAQALILLGAFAALGGALLRAEGLSGSAQAQLVSPAAGADEDWDGLEPAQQRLLSASEDAYNALDFDGAEALAQQAIDARPQQPLPRLVLQGALLARLQELDAAHQRDPATERRFDAATQAVLDAARAWRGGQGAWPDFYRGAALGSRGLVNLYRGSYLSAYRDGKTAALALQAAQDEDPRLEAVGLGLGQYEYYCATLGGFLRFLLNLHGDAEHALALLQACARSHCIAALTARSTLARILAVDLHRAREALPYVQELRARYPRNHWFVGYALACAKQLGPEDSAAQDLAAGIARQWEQGWRPPRDAADWPGGEAGLWAALRGLGTGSAP